LKFPRFKVGVNDHLRNEYVINYLKYQFTKVNNYIYQSSVLKKSNILIKTKDNVTKKERKIINKLVKISFKNNKFQVLLDKKNSYINAEVFASHKNCKAIISNLSTAEFLVKMINSKIKVFDINKDINIFNVNSKFFTKKNVDINNFDLKKYYKMNKLISI
jgi:hypothetical protein